MNNFTTGMLKKCKSLTCMGLTVVSSLMAADCVDEPLPEPLTLEAAERFALEHNKGLISLRNNVQEGCYRRLQARSKWAPSIKLSSEAKKSGAKSSKSTESWESKVAVDQKIYDASTYYGLEKGDLEACRLQVDLLAAINNVLFDVRSAYYDVVLAEEDLQVQKENVDILADALKREERKYEVGESTKFQVRQSKVSLANALSGFYASLRRHKDSRNSLLQLLGLDPEDEIHLVLAESDIPAMEVEFLSAKVKKLGWDQADATEADFVERNIRLFSGELDPKELDLFSDAEVWVWEEEAMDCRPDIRRNGLTLQLANNNLKTKYGEWHPSVSAFAEASATTRSSLSLSDFNDSWKFGGRVSWTLFDGFGRTFRINEAKKGQCAAWVRYEQSIQIARVDINNRFHEIEQALLSYFSARQSVSLSEEALELAKNRRDLGVITPLEYRDAVQSLLQARLTFNRASFGLLRSYYALLRSAGSDLKNDQYLCAGGYPFV